MADVIGYNRIALGNKNDLTTPSSTADYPLGSVVDVTDQDGAVKRYMYVKAHTALTQYQPYVIVPDTTTVGGWITAAPVTLASTANVIGVPQVAFTSAYYGFVQIEGQATAKIGAVTHTIGDHLELLSGGTALVTDGTSGSTVLTKGSTAVSGSVSTGAESATVYLIGRQCEVAAS